MRIQHFYNSLLIGKIWIGSLTDSFMILFVLGSYSILQYYFFYYFSADYQLTNSWISWLCVGMFLYSYLCGTFTEPGVIRKPQPDDDESSTSIKPNDRTASGEVEKYFQERYCSACKVIKPPKCSHCYNCNNCVKMYDHHCTFMSNCIGQRNYKYFIYWIYTLIIQCIIWYSVLFQHTYQMFNMSEAIDKLYESQNLQYATLCLILSFCCQCTFYLRGICQAFISLLLISCCFICLYSAYNFDKLYYQNYFCSLIFVIITFPFAIMAFVVAMKQSFHLAIGVNQKEWSVLDKQTKQRMVRKNSIELTDNFNSNQKSTTQDLDQTIQEDNIEIEIESEEDRQLRQKIIDEIENNSQLKGTLSKEKIEYIFQQRKNYYQRQKIIQDTKLQMQSYKEKASIKNFVINFRKLIFDKMCQSELY